MGVYPKRARILLLLKYFMRHTDEQNPKRLSEIIGYLKQKGIQAERKALYADINLLRDMGFDIVKTTAGKTVYFLGQRVLEMAEAQICASAIAAARFVTQKKSRELIKKLTHGLSIEQGASLTGNMELARTQKTHNEEIYYNIDKITLAQSVKKKISFLYFEYMPDKTLRLKRQGQRYFASPYTLMWFEDAYYLVCNIDKYDNLSHFRVDRMTNVNIEDSAIRSINEVSEYKNYIDFDEYHKSVFGMFGGEPQHVRIRFKDELSSAVFDRFGLDVDVTDVRDGGFTISASVRVSPGFISWLMIFGDKANVLSPQSLREQIHGWVNSLLKNYKN